MSEGTSLINLGELSKPATVLIEKISEAVGGYFKPYQIKRVAKAEAEVEIIKAETQIEITELQRRALTRFILEESIKQENIESITEKAILELTEGANPQNIEDDWITNFFDKCRIISDEEMQSLWAMILAGEANSPGTFSKRTVNFLASLDKEDAKFFTTLCGFCWMVKPLVPIVYDYKADIYKKSGINFSSLNHLEAIGLISTQPLTGISVIESDGFVSYFGTQLNLDVESFVNGEFKVGKVVFTRIGAQLAHICKAEPIDGFFDYTVEKWVEMNLKPNSPYPKLEQDQ